MFKKKHTGERKQKNLFFCQKESSEGTLIIPDEVNAMYPKLAQFSKTLLSYYWNCGLLINEKSHLDKAYTLAKKSPKNQTAMKIIESYKKRFDS